MYTSYKSRCKSDMPITTLPLAVLLVSFSSKGAVLQRNLRPPLSVGLRGSECLPHIQQALRRNEGVDVQMKVGARSDQGRHVEALHSNVCESGNKSLSNTQYSVKLGPSVA